MNEGGLKAIAKVYTKHKSALLELMNEYDAGITRETTHVAIIMDLKYLIENNEEFCEDLDALMIEKEIISSDYQWNNTIGDFFKRIFKRKEDGGESSDDNGGVSGDGGGIKVGGLLTTIIGTAGTVFSGISSMQTAKTQQQIEQDRFLYEMIKEQKKDNTGTILIISGITFAGIGLALYFILKK